MGKFTNIPSEISEFFKEKRRETTISVFTKLIEGLRVNSKMLGGIKRENCQFTNLQIFQLPLLMPVFAVSGFSHNAQSGLGRMFGGKKDLLYSFMSQDCIDWRSIIYRIVVSLITKITMRRDFRKSHLPAVLIADDSDLPKSGLRMEMIGRIFSHVHHMYIKGAYWATRRWLCAGVTVVRNLPWICLSMGRKEKYKAGSRALAQKSARKGIAANGRRTATRKNVKKNISRARGKS